MMKTALNIIGISLCALFLFAAPLVGSFLNYNVENWQTILGLRVLISVVLFLWSAFAIVQMAELDKREGIYVFASGFVIAILVNIFPILDLINGAVKVEGTVEYYYVDKYLDWRPNAMYNAIDADLRVNNLQEDGSFELLEVSISGLQANRMERALTDCKEGDHIFGSVLNYMDYMLELSCE